MPIIPLRPDIEDTLELVDEDQAELEHLAEADLDTEVEVQSLADQRAHRRYRRGLAGDVRGAA